MICKRLDESAEGGIFMLINDVCICTLAKGNFDGIVIQLAASVEKFSVWLRNRFAGIRSIQQR